MGSIRQPPSVITWVRALEELSRGGMHAKDWSSVIQEWNTSTTSHFALTGGKAASVKLILEKMPEECKQFVFDIVSKFTWQKAPWSDDSLSSKKLYPGHIYRHARPSDGHSLVAMRIKNHYRSPNASDSNHKPANLASLAATAIGSRWSKLAIDDWQYSLSEARPGWEKRLVVSVESTLLCFQHAVSQFTTIPPPLRKKVTKNTMEVLSEHAALVQSIAVEAMCTTPLPKEMLKDQFLDLWARDSSPNLNMELTQILAEKPKDFSCHKVVVVMELLEHYQR